MFIKTENNELLNTSFIKKIYLKGTLIIALTDEGETLIKTTSTVREAEAEIFFLTKDYINLDKQLIDEMRTLCCLIEEKMDILCYSLPK